MDEQAKLERVFNYPFGDIYNNYLAKVERKCHDMTVLAHNVKIGMSRDK